MKKTISCVCSTVKSDGLHWRADPDHVSNIRPGYLVYKLKVSGELFYSIRDGEDSDRSSRDHEYAIVMMNDLLYGHIKERIRNAIRNIIQDAKYPAIDELKAVLKVQLHIHGRAKICLNLHHQGLSKIIRQKPSACKLSILAWC